jgi:1-acyl-sn-glycerol-3-phosphate acyltransferase
MVDVLAVFALRAPFLWVSKVENFYVPFLGWNMWLNGYVPLRRGHLPSIMRMVRTCHRRLRDGHSLFVFPEGTRSTTGELIRFYPGAFRMAVRFGVPIVPVVPVLLRVLEPVKPSDVGGDHRRLLDVVRSRMQRELHAIRGTAIAAD